MDGDFKQSVEVLPTQRVHGIRIDEESQKILVFGGKYISILNFNENVLELEDRLKPFSDWIKDATWIRDHDGTICIGIMTAHNWFELWKPNKDVWTRTMKVECEVHCILYAAEIFGRSIDELILLSGTVFNENLIWNLDIRNRNDQEEARVLKTLKGHEGVIFRVRANLLEDGRLTVTSVSDDRYIRMWTLNANVIENPDFGSLTEHQSFFGHDARVWDAVPIFQHGRMVTVSEDATCRIWDLKTRQLIRTETGHSGKGVWCCAVHPKSGRIVTGGNDAGLCQWSLLDETQGTMRRRCIDDPAHLIRNFTMLSSDVLVRTGDDGTTAFLSLETPNESRIVVPQVCRGSELTSCFLGPELGHLIFAAAPGDNILVFHISSSFEFRQMTTLDTSMGSILRILTKATMKTDGSVIVDCIVAYIRSCNQNTEAARSGDSQWFQIYVAPNDTGLSFDYRYVALIKYPEVPGVKLAAKVPHGFSAMNVSYVDRTAVLILGESHGYLNVYVLHPDSRDSDAVTELVPSDSILATIRKSILTDCIIEPQTETEFKILTVGRDGCLGTFQLSIFADVVALDPLSHVSVSKGCLERIEIVNGDILVCGFFNKAFFCTNYSRNKLIFEEQCGGYGRRWELHTFPSSKRGCTDVAFGYIRNQQVHVYVKQLDRPSDIALVRWRMRDGNGVAYHGRETRAIKFISDTVFATAGEDCLIKVFLYNPNDTLRVSELTTLKKHTSFVSCLELAESQVVPGSKILFSAGGREELVCWRFIPQTLSSGNNSFNISELASCFPISEILETRIMGMSVVPADQVFTSGLRTKGLFIVMTVYSDSMLRVWLFDEDSRRFFIVGRTEVTQRCLQQVRHVLVENAGDTDTQIQRRLFAVTGATDGDVRVYDLTNDIRSFVEAYVEEQTESDIGRVLTTVHGSTGRKIRFQDGYTRPLSSECYLRYKMHQSGIQTLGVSRFDASRFWIATGGDDNSISACMLDFNAGQIVAHTKYEFAHASSVQDIVWWHGKLLSTSIDQRLNQWNLIFDEPNNNIELQLEDAVYLDIADIAAMDASERVLAITGVGLQLIGRQKEYE